jgi:hypothetical protein
MVLALANGLPNREFSCLSLKPDANNFQIPEDW